MRGEKLLACGSVGNAVLQANNSAAWMSETVRRPCAAVQPRYPMTKQPVFAVLALALALAGCSTPDSRIEKNSAAFAAYTPAVQTKIRAGEVDVGFTSEMVQMALGKPDRVLRRRTASGTTEVWVYADNTPTIGFGVGIGGGGHHSGGGVAVGTSTGGDREDRLRVIFDSGKVSAVERRD